MGRRAAHPHLDGIEQAELPAGALLDPLRRRQPHPLPPGALLGGQPTTLGVPHATGIAHTAAAVSGARNARRYQWDCKVRDLRRQR